MSKNKFSNSSKKLITGIGYFWIILSVAIAIWQIVDFLFDLPNYNFNDYRAWLIGCAVIIGSCILASLLTVFFPSILDIIDDVFDKRPEETKYFSVDLSSERENLTSSIYASLPYLEDDQVLLESIKAACFGVKPDINPDYERAINIGKSNSKLFQHLGKNYLRIINGIYSLYALEKGASAGVWKRKCKKGRYDYCKYFFIINDIGWGLIDMSTSSTCTCDMEKLQELLLKERDDNDVLISQIIKPVLKIDFNCTARENGEELILKARDELREIKSFPKLYAQAIRHSLSFEQCRNTESDALKTFEKVIKDIKNKKDRAQMLGNMKFLRAYLIFDYYKNHRRDNNYLERIRKAIDFVKSAQEEYEKINDRARYAKCFNLEGKLFLKLEDTYSNDEAKKLFKEGLNASTSIQRYDQILLNLLSLVELNDEDKEEYAKKGLTLSIELKNLKYENIFNKYIKTKHVFLVRHGESKKNISKTISGEGPLTDEGKNQIREIKRSIGEYLENHGYSWDEVKIYGIEKRQITDSIKIIVQDTNIDLKTQVCNENELLKPIDMGILAGKNEDVMSMSELENNARITLSRWRNGMVNACELESSIPAIEHFDSYWGRAKKFFELITASSDSIIIVICTTSVAVFLAQYLLNSNLTAEEYKCLDIPIGAIIHFSEIPNRNRYKLVNRDNRTNILFSSIESN